MSPGRPTPIFRPTGISDGNTDSFVAKYDANGNQSWVKQIPTLANNAASSVSVDASGNIYIGGQVSGLIGSGQTNNGGKDGYVAKLDSKGNIAYEQQLGTSGDDTVAATAVDSSGSLFVASVQNGHAILTKYANGDATSAAAWTEDLGALQNGGSIGGLAVSGGKVYLSGTSSNGALTSGGQASVVGATSGGLDAFVAGFTDNGSSASADTVTYVGTGFDRQGRQAGGGFRRHGLSHGHDDGHLCRPDSQRHGHAERLRHGARYAAAMSAGRANMAAPAAPPPAMASPSTRRDPAFWIGWACRAASIDINQSVDLTSTTTLRPGTSFKIKIDTAASSRTATITIDAGETLQYARQQDQQRDAFAGKASVTYASGGHGLKIEVNKGISATLIAGSGGLDALGRLGIEAGTISNDATTSSGSSGSSEQADVRSWLFGTEACDRNKDQCRARRALNC